MMYLEKKVIHPFLAASFPVLMIYINNIEQTPFTDLLLPLLLSILIPAVLFFILNLIVSNKYKSGLILFTAVVLFFSFGHVNMVINYIITRFQIQLIIWGVIFLTAVIYILKSKNLFHKITAIINFFVLMLILISVIRISAFHITKINSQIKSQENKTELTNTSFKLNDSKHPDIYYIILDGYARNDILKSVYNFDNHEFTKFLTDNGFYIAEKSRANYVLTPLSVASSLNMDYLDTQIDQIDRNLSNMQPMIEMIYNNKVLQEFNKLGYKTIFLKSIWGGKRDKISADEIIDDKKHSQFSIMVVYTTVLAPYMDKIGIINNQKNSILTSFSKLSEIPQQEYATFIYAHILLPHPPYIFGKNGETVSYTDMKFHGNVWRNKEAYINQLIFVNNKVISLINEIFKKSNHKPFIIIQADHGTASGLENKSWNTSDSEAINERVNIFNAYYLQNDGDKHLYQTITPVNTFRLIFNNYFGIQYDLLKDESFFSSYEKPFEIKLIPLNIKRF